VAATNSIGEVLLRAAQTSESRPHVILVFDLHGATPAVYARLSEDLRRLQYSKVAEDTTWEAHYQQGVDLDVALSNTKTEFATCARKAGAARYDLRIYGSAVPMKSLTASQ